MDYDGSRIKQWAGDSQWRAWKADLARFKKWGYSGWGSEGFWALTLYRLQRSVCQARPRLVWMPVAKLLAIVKKLFTLLTHINLDPHCDIGPGCLIPHVGSIRIGDGAKIGADCAIHHVCTIGAGAKPGAAVIGDHVMIGCHTSILGPVRIGDRVNIAAQSLVITDIPAGATAVGVPARILPGRWRLDEVAPEARQPCTRPALASTPALVPEPVEGILAALLRRADVDRAALTLFQGAGNYRSLSYRDLAKLVCQLRDKLNQLLPERAPVILFCQRTPESVALILAAMASARPFSCLNSRWQWPQVHKVLAAAETKTLFIDDDGAAMLERAATVERVGYQTVALQTLLAGTAADGRSLAPETCCPPWPAQERPGCYLFTSGSTGIPKGVVIGERDLTWRAHTDVALFGLGPDDVLLNILPISFDVGLNQILAGVLAGCETVLCQSFLPADIATLAKERRVTGIPCVPSVWQDFINLGLRLAGPGEGALRFVTISGGDMSPSHLQRMREVVGDTLIYKTYGQTEAFRATTLRPTDFDDRRLSVGQPYPGVTVAIVHPDGSLANCNETGELVHVGLGIMMGYLGDRDGTAAKVRTAVGLPGRLVNYSGDKAFMDPEGYVHLLGRGDQMLKIKGNRVYPAEVRNHICEIAGVQDALVLVEQGRRGDTCLVAFIVAKPLADRSAIAKAVRARLPGYMVPEAIECIDAIPRAANGKPDGEALRSAARQLLASAPGAAGGSETGASSLLEQVRTTIALALREKHDGAYQRLTDVLDSIAFLELIGTIESRHNLRVDLATITTADMSSAEALAAAVSRPAGR